MALSKPLAAVRTGVHDEVPPPRDYDDLGRAERWFHESQTKPGAFIVRRKYYGKAPTPDYGPEKLKYMGMMILEFSDPESYERITRMPEAELQGIIQAHLDAMPDSGDRVRLNFGFCLVFKPGSFGLHGPKWHQAWSRYFNFIYDLKTGEIYPAVSIDKRQNLYVVPWRVDDDEECELVSLMDLRLDPVTQRFVAEVCILPDPDFAAIKKQLEPLFPAVKDDAKRDALPKELRDHVMALRSSMADRLQVDMTGLTETGKAFFRLQANIIILLTHKIKLCKVMYVCLDHWDSFRMALGLYDPPNSKFNVGQFNDSKDQKKRYLPAAKGAAMVSSSSSAASSSSSSSSSASASAIPPAPEAVPVPKKTEPKAKPKAKRVPKKKVKTESNDDGSLAFAYSIDLMGKSAEEAVAAVATGALTPADGDAKASGELDVDIQPPPTSSNDKKNKNKKKTKNAGSTDRDGDTKMEVKDEGKSKTKGTKRPLEEESDDVALDTTQDPDAERVRFISPVKMREIEEKVQVGDQSTGDALRKFTQYCIMGPHVCVWVSSPSWTIGCDVHEAVAKLLSPGNTSIFDSEGTVGEVKKMVHECPAFGPPRADGSRQRFTRHAICVRPDPHPARATRWQHMYIPFIRGLVKKEAKPQSPLKKARKQ